MDATKMVTATIYHAPFGKTRSGKSMCRNSCFRAGHFAMLDVSKMVAVTVFHARFGMTENGGRHHFLRSIFRSAQPSS
jgi:hypothetical protein